MKLLIIAGPYEADLIRRAAVADGAEAVAVEAGESLAGWIAATRPDLIVVATRAVHAEPQTAVARIRSAPGGDVPILLLCDPGEEAASRAAADAVLARPVAPDLVVKRATALASGRPVDTGEFAAAGSSARKRSPSQSGARGLPSGAAPPSLKPLTVDTSQVGPLPTDRVAAPWMKHLAASIEDALDVEMHATLQSVVDPKGARATPETTRQVPRELVESLLHAVAARTAVAGADARADARGGFTDIADPGSAAGLAGDLARVELPQIMGRALIEGLTGRLRVRRGDVEKSVFFEAGRPVLAVSSAVQDRMVQMLVRLGRLSPEQAREAVAVATRTGRRMGAVLIDLGFMKSSELLPAVRQHYEDIVASLFGWEEGTFRFEVGSVADPRRVRLLRHPAALVLEGLRRSYNVDRLRRSAGSAPSVWRLDARTSSSDVLLEIGGGDPLVQRVPVLFDGVRALSEVVRVSALPESVVLPVTITLRAFGLLVSGAMPLPVAQPLDAATARDRERDQAIDRERLNARLALVKEGDYFQVLGLGRDAGADDVRQAHDVLMRELSDDVLGATLATERAADLRDVRSVLTEALTVLGDARTRNAYTARLSDETNVGASTSAPGVVEVA